MEKKDGLRTRIECCVPCALLCSMTRRLEILSLWSTGVANKLGQLNADVDSKVVLLSSAVGDIPDVFANDNDVLTV